MNSFKRSASGGTKPTDFRNARVAIVGAGREAQSMISYLRTQSVEHLLLLDKSPDVSSNGAFSEIEMRTGPAYLRSLDDIDILVRSPGVPFLTPEIQAALARGVTVTSLTKIFFERCPASIIGITGSNGKTTTTNLIAHLFAASGRFRTVWRSGNDAAPLITQLDEITPDDRVVLELSSFQLQDMTQSPHIAVVTNITPNHLDTHRSLDEYADAKRNIVAHQTADDVAILNGDDDRVKKFSTKGTAIYVSEHDTLPIEMNTLPFITMKKNILMAVQVARIEGMDDASIVRGLQTFTTPHQRLEKVRVLDDVTYINDSACTTPESVIVALRAFPIGSVVLIVGGRNKGMSFTELGREIVARQTRTVLIGESAQDIEHEIHAANAATSVQHASSLQDAIEIGRKLAHPGDYLLLSPACTSFDMFKNSKDRGEQFNALVNGLR